MDIDYVDVIYHECVWHPVASIRRASMRGALSEESCDGRQKCGAQSLRDRQHCE